MQNDNTKVFLSEKAINVIETLRHPNGTYQYFSNALRRMINLVLTWSDEIGMSDAEALSTVRTLTHLREDLDALTGPEAMAVLMQQRFKDLADECDGLVGESIARVNDEVSRVLDSFDASIEALEQADADYDEPETDEEEPGPGPASPE